VSSNESQAGYSARPLVVKLGIKTGQRIAILQPPVGYTATLGELPANVVQLVTLQPNLDFIHFFTTSRGELAETFPQLKQALAFTGKLWISWPKRAAKVPTDLDENIVRQIGLDNGLVDVKVAAIDFTWSGLQFVYRLKDRQ
jgi:hypothetical protein